ncbi:hypothetical protein FIBSPDRAFT_962383 [Athelia psychrophila]|uniref:Uncharacterized protein n=1 Tax=Athelia psychrophila TaxID=1759441 RepID=A0A166A646_9AGAM|nr:hypothetical protein FIBSPDRAFT_962383 [Fibularhizoctonia sp. CBS 109695]
MDEVPSDPATQFRRRARITLSSHSSSPSPTQHDPLALTSGDGDDRDENDAELRHSGNSDNSSAQYRSSLSYGQAVKRAKHGMSTKSTADFDSFLKASTLGEHVTLLMATTLEVRDMLAAREVVAVEWKIPAQLKANIKLYSLAFLLSPLIKSYRGKAAESVLDVMRELHITELPPTKETGQVETVLTSIGSALTGMRNVLKTKITESLKLDSATRNIAALTNTVIGKSRVKATLQLYICLAFIRFHVVNYPDIEDEHFWVRVDQTLEEWRKDTTEVELNQTHNDMYLADKELYGDLSASEFRVTDISSIEGWQQDPDGYGGLVESEKCWVTDLQHVLLAHPLAKPDSKLVFNTFWSLPRQLGVILVFFLGVIRVIELKLLGHLWWPTRWHRCHIFIRNTKPKALSKSLVFNTQSLNARLKKGTPDYPLGIMEYQKLMQSIFDTHFSPLYTKELEALEQALKDSENQGAAHMRCRQQVVPAGQNHQGQGCQGANTAPISPQVDIPSWMQPADMLAIMGDTRTVTSTMQIARFGAIKNYFHNSIYFSPVCGDWISIYTFFYKNNSL